MVDVVTFTPISIDDAVRHIYDRRDRLDSTQSQFAFEIALA